MHNGSAQPSCIPPASSTSTSSFLTIAVGCMSLGTSPRHPLFPCRFAHEWQVRLPSLLVSVWVDYMQSYFSNMWWFYGVDLWDVSWESTLSHSTQVLLEAAGQLPLPGAGQGQACSAATQFMMWLIQWYLFKKYILWLGYFPQYSSVLTCLAYLWTPMF